MIDLGFLTQLHTSLYSVRETLEGVVGSIHSESRATIRLLVGEGVSTGVLRELCVGDLQCEAIVPVATGDVGAIVYFGWNRHNRTTAPDLAVAQNRLLQIVMNHQLNVRVLPADYSVECWWPGECLWSQQDVEDLLQIYRAAFTGYLVDFS
jgi:hypothetical protein